MIRKKREPRTAGLFFFMACKMLSGLFNKFFSIIHRYHRHLFQFGLAVANNTNESALAFSYPTGIPLLIRLTRNYTRIPGHLYAGTAANRHLWHACWKYVRIV